MKEGLDGNHLCATAAEFLTNFIIRRGLVSVFEVN
jgi:hypothetical protein